jgi:hypothetical protein
MLEVSSGFRGDLRKLLFLLGREIYFHSFTIRENPGVRQVAEGKGLESFPVDTSKLAATIRENLSALA